MLQITKIVGSLNGKNLILESLGGETLRISGDFHGQEWHIEEGDSEGCWALAATIPNGTRRLLTPRKGRLRRQGTPILATTFQNIVDATMDLQNERCWR